MTTADVRGQLLALAAEAADHDGPALRAAARQILSRPVASDKDCPPHHQCPPCDDARALDDLVDAVNQRDDLAHGAANIDALSVLGEDWAGVDAQSAALGVLDELIVDALDRLTHEGAYTDGGVS